jgi:hypothetical protein
MDAARQQTIVQSTNLSQEGSWPTSISAFPKAAKKLRSKTANCMVPDQPIVGYVEGDGIGPDITRASLARLGCGG